MCCLETDLSASDLPLSDNVAYSSAHVETCSYSEAYDFMDKTIKTSEPDYAAVAAGNMHNTFTFPFGCYISRKTILHTNCTIITYSRSDPTCRGFG